MGTLYQLQALNVISEDFCNLRGTDGQTDNTFYIDVNLGSQLLGAT